MPVSILNGMSKMYGRYIIHNSLSSLLVLKQYYQILYQLTKSPIVQIMYVLLRLIENWKKSRDKKNFMGTVLMDLSKAGDCNPHDLLPAKLHVYSLS